MVIRMIMNKTDDDDAYIMPDMVLYTPWSPFLITYFILQNKHIKQVLKSVVSFPTFPTFHTFPLFILSRTIIQDA